MAMVPLAGLTRPIEAIARASRIEPDPWRGPMETDPWRGLKVGVASYTFRKHPLDYTIKAIGRVGLKYVSIKEAHLPLKSTAEERRSVVQKFKAAGITPLSCGNISMKGTEEELRASFEYARDAGLPTIVCAPRASVIPLLDRLVKEYDIRLAIHNHGPGDEFPSPYDAMKVIEPYDKRIGLCIDVGHTLRAKVDPAEAILKCRDRVFDMHLKDLVSDDVKATDVEVGRGVMNMRAIFRALITIKYQHLADFEFEKDADDPLPGLAESVGYTKALVADM
jgi:inosose dehydratase